MGPIGAMRQPPKGSTGGFLLYVCILIHVYIYIYICTYTRNKRTLHLCGKAKAAETHEKAPDAGRLTFQNVGLHFSFVESVGL